MKYYIVSARCGHVGKDYYIVKQFAIMSEDGKTAAQAVRNMPRVLHHDKKAIINVEEVSYVEFYNQTSINNEDPYFRCKSRQEQNVLCGDMMDKLIEKKVKTIEDYKEKRIERVKLKFSKYQAFMKIKMPNIITAYN